MLDCARGEGLAAIDTYPQLQRLLLANGKPDLAAYYVGGIGHMTARGNEPVADAIAAHLRPASPQCDAMPAPHTRCAPSP